MTPRGIKWVVTGVVSIAAVFLIAQWFLGSRIGRDLVEQQLEKVLALQVELQEEFSFTLFPGPGVEGSGISIASLEGEPVLSTRSYFARVAFWPLLRGEVEVVSLVLEHIRIPAGVDRHIHFQTLTLSRNVAEGDLLIEANGGLADQNGDFLSASLAGILNYTTAGLISLETEALDIDYGGFALTDIQGTVSLQSDEMLLTLDLLWAGSGQAVRVAGRLDVGLLTADDRPVVHIEQIELRMGDFHVEGKGCFFPGERGELHLMGKSDALNLDALLVLSQEILRDTRHPGPERVGQSEDERTPFDLPFEPFVRLELARANYQGAVAEGIVFRVGESPNCEDS